MSIIFFTLVWGQGYNNDEETVGVQIHTTQEEIVDRLQTHVYTLSQEIGDRSVFRYEKLLRAKQYIEEEFKAMGYQVESQPYTVMDKRVENIIVRKKGAISPEEILVVGAHYDTCNNPGADDNASAVAGLLELARRCITLQLKRTIEFVAFVNEEPPFFKTEEMGSVAYAVESKKQDKNIVGVVVLEMIGYYSDKKKSQEYPPFYNLFYPDRGNFIALVSNYHSRPLMNAIEQYFKQEVSFPIQTVIAAPFLPGADFSDHASFWEKGYAAVMVTDTAFYRNQNYHTQQDTYETLDYVRMAEVVQGIFAAIRGLAKE